MERGLSVPNVGPPDEVVALARDAEAAGWDGFFVWDHVQVFAGAGFEVHDPWMLLAAVAVSTDRVRLGAMVTPPSRRRPWVLAKQLVTLDHLSRGRAVVGVGLGFPEADEFGAFGEATELRERAQRTDEALTIVDRVLRGEPVDHDGEHFEVHAHLHPAAVQRPRPKVWVAATPPYRQPLERARRWDGVYVNLHRDDFRALRPSELQDWCGDLLADPAKDVVTTRHADHAPEDYRAIGVDWLVDMGMHDPGWVSLRAQIGLA